MAGSSHILTEIITQVRRDYPSLSPLSEQFMRLIAKRAELHELSSSQVTELAVQIGLKWYPRPKNVPESWKLVICKDYLAQRYNNPDDPYEYIVVVRSDMRGGRPYIVHRTPEGYADVKWFYEVFPQLDKLLKDPAMGRPFSMSFNQIVNGWFRDAGKEMRPGHVQALNLFFEKYVPGIKGICSTCFMVSLPRSGAGIRYTHRENEVNEIRLSAAKPAARFLSQRVEYVTHTELTQDGNVIYITWDNLQGVAGSSPTIKQSDTHIPWEVYDFNQCSIGMPTCKCPKKLEKTS